MLFMIFIFPFFIPFFTIPLFFFSSIFPMSFPFPFPGNDKYVRHKETHVACWWVTLSVHIMVVFHIFLKITMLLDQGVSETYYKNKQLMSVWIFQHNSLGL